MLKRPRFIECHFSMQSCSTLYVPVFRTVQNNVYLFVSCRFRQLSHSVYFIAETSP